jgi:hypothetical protein
VSDGFELGGSRCHFAKMGISSLASGGEGVYMTRPLILMFSIWGGRERIDGICQTPLSGTIDSPSATPGRILLHARARRDGGRGLDSKVTSPSIIARKADLSPMQSFGDEGKEY